MPHTVFLDLESTCRNDLDLSRLKAACTSLQTWSATSLKQRLAHIGHADIVISNKVVLDADVLKQLRSQVKLICVAATGTNNIDLHTAEKFGIPVVNVRDYASQSVAEHVMALIFSLTRQLPAYQQSLRQGDWQRSQHFCLLDHSMGEIAGKTLGIIGYGTLGQATAKLARAVGMNVIIAERPQANTLRPERRAFTEVLASADIISLHCPLTDETRNMIDAAALHKMQRHALLINTARGGIVDEHALLNALQSGEIAGAGMDVLLEEPPNDDAPLLSAALPNLLVTPHIAWASRRARQTLIDQLADIISQWRDNGTLLNRVV